MGTGQNRDSELTHHIQGMADSLDDSVSHEDIYSLLREASEMSRKQDEILAELTSERDEARKSYELVRDAIIEHLDPTEDDIAEEAIMIQAIEYAAASPTAVDAVVALCDTRDDEHAIAQEGYPTRLLAEPVLSVTEVRAVITRALKGE